MKDLSLLALLTISISARQSSKSAALNSGVSYSLSLIVSFTICPVLSFAGNALGFDLSHDEERAGRLYVQRAFVSPRLTARTPLDAVDNFTNACHSGMETLAGSAR